MSQLTDYDYHLTRNCCRTKSRFWSRAWCVWLIVAQLALVSYAAAQQIDTESEKRATTSQTDANQAAANHSNAAPGPQAIAGTTDSQAQVSDSAANEIVPEGMPGTQRRRKAYAALMAVAGIAVFGIGAIAITMLWARRLRRLARDPGPEQTTTGNDFWFLKPPKPVVSDTKKSDCISPDGSSTSKSPE